MRKLIFELLTTAGFCCTTVFATISLGSFAASSLANDALEPIYKDPAQPIEARVEDLLKRMSLEEKVAQLQTVWEQRQALETDEGVFSDAHAARILGLGIGQVARPTENKAPLSPNKSPEKTVAFVNAVQKWLLENTRWAIPAIFHEEALHGHAAPGATSFPQAIALASTWDPALVQEVYSITAAEVRRRGAQQALTPILDVARDPRWGRFEETMGEDPYLVAAMGVAAVRGFQGDGPGIPKDKVIATLKHLAGHGEPRGGLNIAPTPVGDRELREVFLFPFEAAVKVAGARSVMASYNEIDGIPSHSNKTLLQDILRNEWHFDGVVVSDYFAIRELLSRHHITDSKAGAAKIALEAGVDVEMPDGDAYRHLVELVKSGQVTIDTVDTVVKRILHEKFMLGLFEDPYVEPRGVEEFVGREEHRGVAQRAAEKAMVLLKNDDDLLPFDASEIGSIAVIGPHADETLLGGYSDVPTQTVSVLDGIAAYLDDRVEIRYEQGTLITLNHWTPAEESRIAGTFSKERWHTDEVRLATAKDTRGMIEAAVKAAERSDVALVVVGGNEATSREAWVESHKGDRTGLHLLGQQQKLVDAVLATGTPTVVLLLNGRPLAIAKVAESVPAIIEGWYLGQETGHAVARVLFGDVNPGGKLPVSIPRSVGHIPVYYNHKPTAKRGYAFGSTDALFPFGHGLSYTTFKYSDLTISTDKAKPGEVVNVAVKVTNTGKRAGDEVVQLYVRDPVASVTRPVKVLKGFKRLTLAPGKSATVTFSLAINQLGFYGRDMNFIVEPGAIELMLGSSSTDIRLTGSFTIAGDAPVEVVGSSKRYLTPVQVTPL